MGARDARYVCKTRRHVVSAYVENSFRVGLRAVPGSNDCLVARTLALVYEARTDPPDERMKPEHRLHDHVDRGCEVVTPADVAELVLEDGLQLLVTQLRGDLFWQQQHGAANSDDAGFMQRRRAQHGNRR